jgi:hypothetical protein
MRAYTRSFPKGETGFKPVLKAPMVSALETIISQTAFTVAFKFNLRRYSMVVNPQADPPLRYDGKLNVVWHRALQLDTIPESAQTIKGLETKSKKRERFKMISSAYTLY